MLETVFGNDFVNDFVDDFVNDFVDHLNNKSMPEKKNIPLVNSAAGFVIEYFDFNT